MSPWQTPNFSASTLADQMTQFTTQWQQALSKWQAGVEGMSSTPAAFWQSVSSIQSAQARFVSEFCQRQPAHLATLFQCKTFPQLVECISRWNGHNLTAAINLGMVIQAHRSSFFAQWQRQFPLQANAAALANMWKSGLNSAQSTAQTSTFANTFANTFSNGFANPFTATSANSTGSSSSKTASSTPTAGTVSATTQQTTSQASGSQSSSQSSSIAKAATSATQTAQATAQIIAAPSITAHTALTQPESTEQLTLLNGTNGSAIISSTANSVMRSSGGSTIAAAAARRSVVARRTANNRRRAPR